jgi:hypothetical protein
VIDLPIRSTWDGQPIGADEACAVSIGIEGGVLRGEIEAPLHGDPPPPGRAGRLPGLWDYEVVEVFVAGPGERYVEVEVSPHGHHLALRLVGVRHVVDDALPLSLSVERSGARWRARWELLAPLPTGPLRANAYSIHGSGAARRYLAHRALPGPKPDFHQPARFVAI